MFSKDVRPSGIVWEGVKGVSCPSNMLDGGEWQFPGDSCVINSFPKQQILHSSKLKEFAEDNFKFDENGRKFFKREANTKEKGEIACSKQFLLFPPCFRKICTADMYKPGLVWERINQYQYA